MPTSTTQKTQYRARFSNGRETRRASARAYAFAWLVLRENPYVGEEVWKGFSSTRGGAERDMARCTRDGKQLFAEVVPVSFAQ